MERDLAALEPALDVCRSKALERSWPAATQQFLSHLALPVTTGDARVGERMQPEIQ